MKSEINEIFKHNKNYQKSYYFYIILYYISKAFAIKIFFPSRFIFFVMYKYKKAKVERIFASRFSCRSRCLWLCRRLGTLVNTQIQLNLIRLTWICCRWDVWQRERGEKQNRTERRVPFVWHLVVLVLVFLVALFPLAGCFLFSFYFVFHYITSCCFLPGTCRVYSFQADIFFIWLMDLNKILPLITYLMHLNYSKFNIVLDLLL